MNRRRKNMVMGKGFKFHKARTGGNAGRGKRLLGILDGEEGGDHDLR